MSRLENMARWTLILILFVYSLDCAADEAPLCVVTKGGVVHITSGAVEGTADCPPTKSTQKKVNFKKQGVHSDTMVETLLLEDGEAISKFAVAKRAGLLEQESGSALSGPAGAALELWMRLNERATGSDQDPFVVLQYGDSHSQGGTLSDQIRRRLAHSPISPGLINVNFPMNWGVSVTKSRHWKRRNWLRDREGSFGPLGIVFDSRQPGDTLTIRLPGTNAHGDTTRVTVLYDGSNGLSSFKILDGDDVVSQVIRNQLAQMESSKDQLVVDEVSGLAKLHLSVPSHRTVITLQSGLETSNGEPLSIYGFVIQYSGASLEWDNLGVSGTEIGHLVTHGDASVESYLKWRAPDLFVLWFGTNSLNDPKLTEGGYRRLFRTYLNRVARAMPGSTCLVIGPPDFMKRPKECFMSSSERRALKGRRSAWKRKLLKKNRVRRVCKPDELINHRKRGRYRFPVPGVRTMGQWKSHRERCEFRSVRLLNEIVSIQKRVAHEAGCLFFDTLKFMGGPGGMHEWACMKPERQASLDHIHLNARGYRKLGDGIVDSINQALERLEP